MNLNYKNFDLCCRTCLRDDSEELYEIFQKDANGTVDIAELISTYTSIQMTMEDELPKKICNSCYSCLLNTFDFKHTALKADAELRKHFAKISTDEKKEVESINQNNNMIEIKFEQEYNKYQTENNLDDSVDSDMAVKEEINSFNITTMYSDISDASQREDLQAKRQKLELKCDECNKKFKSQSKLDSHTRKKKCLSLHICKVCSKTFKYYHKYMGHLITHTSESDSKHYMAAINHNTDQRTQCDVCSATFNSINSLSAHKRKHASKDRVLSCSVCSKVFKKLSHLKRHELCHENNRPFKCSKCPKSFTTEGTLTEHENKHNGIKPHYCPICPKSFAHLSTLTSHIKIHTREKPYLCPTCGKRFDSSTNLNQHMKRHLGLKLFACNMCPKKFVSKGELKSHGVTHTREKLYSCDECNATFTKCSSVTKHKLTHLGIKPYQCDACPMKFTCKDHLKRHNRIHTGERPYRCEICDRTFTQSADLIKHTRSHLGNNLYKCTECTQSFRLKTELSQHISEHFISARLEALKMTSSDTPQTSNSNAGILEVPRENGVVHNDTDNVVMQ